MRRWLLAGAGALLSLAFWVAVALGAERVDIALARARGPMGWSVGGIDAGMVVALAGVPAYAAALRFWYARIDREPPGLPDLRWTDALIGAALSGGYWLFCATLLFGMFAGDPRPGINPQPPGQVYRQEAIVSTVLIALYTALSRWWRRRLMR